MQRSVESDPALTLGTAKELIETACKTILEERGTTPPPDWDLGKLGKETREVLGLLPATIPVRPEVLKRSDASCPNSDRWLRFHRDSPLTARILQCLCHAALSSNGSDDAR
jgi:hypothetical protein